jgi:hypothetical protein
MRRLVALFALAAVAGPALSQESILRDEVPARFGIPGLTGLYPQTTPKAALESALKAVDKQRFDYVVAHILDEAFVETRIGKRALELAPAAEADLRARREKQRQNPAAATDVRLSMVPAEFATAVDAETRQRAYKAVVDDVKSSITDDPEGLKELRRFAREGVVAEDGDKATITLRDVRDRKVFLKRVNGRWFVENRQAETAEK